MKLFLFIFILMAVTSVKIFAFNSLVDDKDSNNVSVGVYEEFRILDVLARQINKAINIANMAKCDERSMTDYDYASCLLALNIEKAYKQRHKGSGSTAVALVRNHRGGWELAVATERPLDETIIKNSVMAWVYNPVDYVLNNYGERWLGDWFESQIEAQNYDYKSIVNGVRVGNVAKRLSNRQRDIDIGYLALTNVYSSESPFVRLIYSLISNPSKIKIIENARGMHAEIVLAEYMLSRKKVDALGSSLNGHGLRVPFTYIGSSIKNCKKCSILLRGELTDPTFKSLNHVQLPKNEMVIFTQGWFSSGYPCYVLPSWIKGNQKEYVSHLLDRYSTPSQDRDPVDLFLEQSVGPHSFIFDRDYGYKFEFTLKPDQPTKPPARRPLENMVREIAPCKKEEACDDRECPRKRTWASMVKNQLVLDEYESLSPATIEVKQEEDDAILISNTSDDEIDEIIDTEVIIEPTSRSGPCLAITTTIAPVPAKVVVPQKKQTKKPKKGGSASKKKNQRRKKVKRPS